MAEFAKRSPAEWAAEAGKDVYCEKPTAVTIRGADVVEPLKRRFPGLRIRLFER